MKQAQRHDKKSLIFITKVVSFSVMSVKITSSNLGRRTLNRDFGVTLYHVQTYCHIELSRGNVPLGPVSSFRVYDTVSLKLANTLLFQSREFVYLC